MSDHVIAIIGLALVFAVSTTLSVHMGVLAFVAAFVVGTAFAGQSADQIFAGFPGDLFVVLVGVTFLFAIARDNGTVDWLVHVCMKAVGGRTALMPWVMFLVTALLAGVGAVTPAAVGIIAPIGLSVAKRYGINPFLMGVFIANGGSAGGFSPIGVFGTITNGVVERNDIPGSPGTVFLVSLAFNLALNAVAFLLFGGRRLIGHRVRTEPEPDPEPSGGGGVPAPSARPSPGGGAVTVVEPEEDRLTAATGPVRLDLARSLTLLGILGLVVGALFFDLDVGLLALSVAAVLSFVSPAAAEGAADKCAWGTVLLVCGIVTYVSLMEHLGTIDWLGDRVASIDAPLLAALLICLIGAVVTVFASTTGILGALIPLAVPLLADGDVSAIGLVAALAVSSSIVDASPFSTSGALVTANTPADQREFVFRRLMVWGFTLVPLIPLVSWGLLVVPGW
ncbi:SLC13 family permease [Streptomyces sp. NPDC048172]|uniref:SLC13 family permease n=1 Tax=Streptomyces sp. NPDC048172 TaxID=3365505 RepID=UPI0037235C26